MRMYQCIILSLVEATSRSRDELDGDVRSLKLAMRNPAKTFKRTTKEPAW